MRTLALIFRMDLKIISLKVSETQISAIKNLFEQSRWEYVEVENEKEDNVTDHADSELEDETFDPSDQEPGYVIAQSASDDECPHCLCRPCITNERNRQEWWPRASLPPHINNKKPRKDDYYRFWTMLFHRRVWRDVRYHTKKKAALGLDPSFNLYMWMHRRDIMPDCVLKLVRGWYPNPPNVPYVGHLWENV